MKNQPSLPMKSKIVACGMIVIGVICGISVSLVVIWPDFYLFGLYTLFLSIIYLLISPPIILETHNTLLFFSPYFFLSLLFILFGFLLFKRKKWAWWGTVLFLIAEIWFVTYQLILAFPAQNIFIPFNLSLYTSGIFLIMLFLDKKNYFKEVSKFE